MAKNTEEKLYEVADLAEALGLQEASVRLALRNDEVPRKGKKYQWKKTAFDALVAKMKKKREKAAA